MCKYRVYELDVWGNIDDGFTVNDVFKTPRYIDIFDADTNKDILKKLSEWYLIIGDTEIDWTDSDVYVNNSDGMPLLCLHREVSEKIGISKRIKNKLGKYTWKTILNSDGSVKLYDSKADARNWVHDHDGTIADGSYRLIVYRSEEVD